MSHKAAQIREVIDLVLKARDRAGERVGFRTRVLLDMLLLELERELARFKSKSTS